MADVTAELKVLLDVRDGVNNLNELQTEASRTESALSGSFSKILSNAKSMALGFVAFNTMKAALSEGVEAALAQEKAMSQLGQSMKLAGDFSEPALKKFEAFADQMEISTKYGDDVILSQLAIAKSFGVTNTEAQNMVKAAADLAAATGKELEPTLRILGKTMTGVLGPLDELIPGTEKLTAEQLAAGEAIRIVQERYGGSAASELDGYGAATNRLSDAWGNLLENFGSTVIQSDIVTRALDKIAGSLERLNGNSKDRANSWEQITLTPEDIKAGFAESNSAGPNAGIDAYILARRIAIKRMEEIEKEAAASRSQAFLGEMRAQDEIAVAETIKTMDRVAKVKKDAADKAAEAAGKAAKKEADAYAKAAEAEAARRGRENEAAEKASAAAYEAAGERVDADDAARAKAKEDKQKAMYAQIGSVIGAGDGKKAAEQAGIALGAGIADSFVPGLGQAVGPILGVLMQGKEATEKFIREFIDAVPDIVIAIAEASPVVVEALVDSLIMDGGLIRIAAAMLHALEYPFRALGEQMGLDFGRGFNIQNFGATIRGAFDQGADRMHNWRAEFDQAITRFQNSGHEVGVAIANGWKDLPQAVKNAFWNSRSTIAEGVQIGLNGISSSITDAINEAASSLGIPRPAWLDELIDWLTPNGGGTIEGEATNKLNPLAQYGIGLTGDSGDPMEGVVFLLSQINDAVQAPVTTTADVKWNDEVVGKITLKLNRRGVRLRV